MSEVEGLLQGEPDSDTPSPRSGPSPPSESFPSNPTTPNPTILASMAIVEEILGDATSDGEAMARREGDAVHSIAKGRRQTSDGHHIRFRRTSASESDGPEGLRR